MFSKAVPDSYICCEPHVLWPYSIAKPLEKCFKVTRFELNKRQREKKSDKCTFSQGIQHSINQKLVRSHANVNWAYLDLSENLKASGNVNTPNHSFEKEKQSPSPHPTTQQLYTENLKKAFDFDMSRKAKI